MDQYTCICKINKLKNKNQNLKLKCLKPYRVSYKNSKYQQNFCDFVLGYYFLVLAQIHESEKNLINLILSKLKFFALENTQLQKKYKLQTCYSEYVMNFQNSKIRKQKVQFLKMEKVFE